MIMLHFWNKPKEGHQWHQQHQNLHQRTAKCLLVPVYPGFGWTSDCRFRITIWYSYGWSCSFEMTWKGLVYGCKTQIPASPHPFKQRHTMIHLYTHTRTHTLSLIPNWLHTHTHLQHSNIHCTCLLSLVGAGTHLLSQQMHACRVKTFVTTELCLSQQNIFVATKLLLWQNFCHDKHTFVITKDMFCHDKHMFVVTKISLSWQNFFVATEMIPVAAPASDTGSHVFVGLGITCGCGCGCVHVRWCPSAWAWVWKWKQPEWLMLSLVSQLLRFFIHVCERCTQKLNNHPSLAPPKVGMRTPTDSAFYSSTHNGITVTETQAFSGKLEKTVQ